MVWLSASSLSYPLSRSECTSLSNNNIYFVIKWWFLSFYLSSSAYVSGAMSKCLTHCRCWSLIILGIVLLGGQIGLIFCYVLRVCYVSLSYTTGSNLPARYMSLLLLYSPFRVGSRILFSILSPSLLTTVCIGGVSSCTLASPFALIPLYFPSP